MSSEKIYYMVGLVEKERKVALVLPVNLSWADGMVGCIPVFDNEKDAETYADGEAKITELIIEKK